MHAAVEGDALPRPPGVPAGDAERGAALMNDRHRSLCLLCHAGPFPDPHLHGTLAPDLTGIGSRLSEGQLRLRIADMKAINPASIMPTYRRTADDADDGGARRIAAAWRGKPVLEDDEIEDLVAYLATLKE
ncbi:sulfur oxidation c-type cytochrome SoxX [Luteimonas sp. R10]|uniref:sulfur oxidation c-type cytochrome SoxX n=1 Tax=Luteimonas sp. R10 TaxID=3108176 RepID=UPI00308FC249|nr:sulfur oxidation c-type cytochrome SoxX [Luteimonas sp. R10]